MTPLVTTEDVREWVGAPATPESLTALQLIAATASSAITQLADSRTIPAETLKLAALTAASDLWERRAAPHGVRSFGVDGTPVRLGADDLRAARAVLAPYLSPVVI